MKAKMLVSVAVASVLGQAGHLGAQAVTYSFTGTPYHGTPVLIDFVYRSPGYIFGKAALYGSVPSFPPTPGWTYGTWSACTGCLPGSSVGFERDGSRPGPPVYFDVFSAASYKSNGSLVTSLWYFRRGAFGTAGKYEAIGDNRGTLTVQATPEPAAVVLLLTGIVGVVAATRYRRKINKGATG